MFSCLFCNYSTNIKQSYCKHLQSKKHNIQAKLINSNSDQKKGRKMEVKGLKMEVKGCSIFLDKTTNNFYHTSVNNNLSLEPDTNIELSLDSNLEENFSKNLEENLEAKLNKNLEKNLESNLGVKNNLVDLNNLKYNSKKKKKIYKCIYCKKDYKNNKYLINHQINKCIYIPDKIKNKIITKHNNHGNTKLKLELVTIEENKNIKITNNITNNLNNFNQNINNNIQQINFESDKYIEMNAMFYESISHITEDEALDIAKGKLDLYDKFLDKLYDYKGNRNVFIADKREKIIKYLDKDGKLKSSNVNKFISKMVNFNMYRIEELLEDCKSKLEPMSLKIIKQLYNNYHNNDEDTCKELDKQTYIKLLDISEMNKSNFENMLKIQDTNSGKEMIVVEVECSK